MRKRVLILLMLITSANIWSLTVIDYPPYHGPTGWRGSGHWDGGRRGWDDGNGGRRVGWHDGRRGGDGRGWRPTKTWVHHEPSVWVGPRGRVTKGGRVAQVGRRMGPTRWRGGRHQPPREHGWQPQREWQPHREHGWEPERGHRPGRVWRGGRATGGGWIAQTGRPTKGGWYGGGFGRGHGWYGGGFRGQRRRSRGRVFV